jgi:hypothetical protein
MRIQDLSGDEASVYQAVAELEGSRSAPYLQDIARRADLDLEHTRQVLRRLSDERNLVHEVPDSGTPDLGPTYELAPRT